VVLCDARNGSGERGSRIEPFRVKGPRCIGSVDGGSLRIPSGPRDPTGDDEPRKCLALVE